MTLGHASSSLVGSTQANYMNLGKTGELIARNYLEIQGYNFIRANYFARYGEIDLIMEKDGELVFVEVKTRSEGNEVAPNVTLPAAKIRKLEMAISLYLQQYEIEDWRLILVAVTMLENEMARVKTIPL